MVTKYFSLFVWTLVLALSAWSVASAQQGKGMTEKEKQERHAKAVANKDMLGWRVGDEVIFNETAMKIMEKHKIPTDDVYTLTKDFKPEEFFALGDFTFRRSASTASRNRPPDASCKLLNNNSPNSIASEGDAVNQSPTP